MTGGAQHPASCGEWGPHITALVDGELSPAERAPVEAHLRRCPSCARVLAGEQAVKAALRTTVRDLHAPPGLRGRVRAGLERAEAAGRWRRRFVLAGALAAVLSTLAAVGLLYAHGRSPTAAAVARAVRSHRQQTLGPNPVSAAAGDVARVAAWVRAQAGDDVEVPLLDEDGYRLVGARADPTVAPGAISLVYEGPAGRVTCMVVRGPLALDAGEAPAIHSVDRQGTAVAVWSEPHGAYLLIGNLDPATLLRLARSAARQT